jgi:3-phenylpropionate/cinnamic acid dioxygenase small subunit
VARALHRGRDLLGAARAGQKDPFETSSLIHDDRTLLELRVKQYRHARAHARAAAARTVHQVGNVVLTRIGCA